MKKSSRTKREWRDGCS